MDVTKLRPCTSSPRVPPASCDLLSLTRHLCRTPGFLTPQPELTSRVGTEASQGPPCHLTLAGKALVTPGQADANRPSRAQPGGLSLQLWLLQEDRASKQGPSWAPKSSSSPQRGQWGAMAGCPGEAAYPVCSHNGGFWGPGERWAVSWRVLAGRGDQVPACPSPIRGTSPVYTPCCLSSVMRGRGVPQSALASQPSLLRAKPCLGPLCPERAGKAS